MRDLIVVDGYNVLHAGILKGRDRAGWRRPEARAKLLEARSPLAAGPAELRVVFDARGAGEERDIRRSAGAANVVSDDTDAGSPGRDAHRAKRRGPAAGRRPAGVHISAGAAGARADDGRSGRATNVAEGAGESRSPGAGESRSPGAGGIAVLLAPHADERVVDEVRREGGARTLIVITSDRELGRRVREAGGTVIGAGAFLAGLGGGRSG